MASRLHNYQEASFFTGAVVKSAAKGAVNSPANSAPLTQLLRRSLSVQVNFHIDSTSLTGSPQRKPKPPCP